MLGNLSKLLIKAPNFFNNNTTQNTFKNVPKFNNNENPNIFNLNNEINKYNYKYNNIYFRERDFWLKNYEPDINFNHNRRLFLNSKKSPLKKLTYNFIHPTISENKKNTRYSNDNINRNMYLLTDNQINNSDKLIIKNNYSIYRISPTNSKNNKINNLKEMISKTEHNDIKNRKSFNISTNSDLISIHLNDEKITDNIKENKKNNRYKFNSEFPSVHKTLKSQEILFQDRIDKKFNSLTLIKPEIKEQLKTKNRSMVGRKDFLKYQQIKKEKLQNPFCESMKIKEENYYANLNNIKEI
jgi:hypothetical protein